MLTASKRKDLKGKAHHLQPLLQVGKNGVTDQLKEELMRVAKKRGLVKVRFLRSHADEHDRHASAQEIVVGTGLELVSVTGNTAVVWHPDGKQ
ncbi:YhbY family RNA-binding protein [Candidatus Woesearchaeota archaeon]|nr:YhbY family RNA-binding protein [Candidatus Woesearchaeota archaeon]